MSAGFTPVPSAPPELKVITTVKSSTACTALRTNVYFAVGGVLANDSLVEQSGVLLQKTRIDAVADPTNASATGGAGPSSEMDDYQLQQAVASLAKNIEKIQAKLDDSAVFPPNRPLDEHMVRVRAGLRDVLAQQEAELDVLSGTAATNEATDLQSRRDPITETTLHNATTKRALGVVESLQQAVTNEQAAETRLTPEINALVQACR